MLSDTDPSSSSTSRWLAIGGGSGDDACDLPAIAAHEDVSPRAERLIASKSPIPSADPRMGEEMRADRWSADKNPQGKIDLSADEGHLCQGCHTLFSDKLSSMRLLSDENTLRKLQQGPHEEGNESVKSSVAAHIRRVALPQNVAADIQSDRIVLVPGINAAYDMLAFTLFSRGDVVLCPAIFSNRLCDSFEDRAGVELWPVSFSDLAEPKLDVDSFESVYEHAVSQGQSVRAIALSNPHSALGVVFSGDELLALAEWAVLRGLWIIVDATLIGTCTAESHTTTSSPPSSSSLLSLAGVDPEKAASIRRSLVWLYDVGEEQALHGLHFTAVYTHSDRVRGALERLTLMQPCAPLVQRFIKELLDDSEWMSDFRREHSLALLENRWIAVDWLNSMDIPYCKPQAGRWIFLNLREFLPASSMFSEEENFWRQLYTEAGVTLAPGVNFGTAEAGWFRMTLAGHRSELEEGLRRLELYFSTQRQLMKADSVQSASGYRHLEFPDIGHFTIDGAEELVGGEELDLSASMQTPPLAGLLTTGNIGKKADERRRASFSSLADDDDEKFHERLDRLGAIQTLVEEEGEQHEGRHVGVMERMSSDEEASLGPRNLSTSTAEIDWGVYGRPKEVGQTPSLTASAEAELSPSSSVSSTLADGSDQFAPESIDSSPERPRCNLLYHVELGNQTTPAHDGDELLREVFAVFPKERLEWTEWDVDGNKLDWDTVEGNEPGGGRHRKLSREALERRAQLAKRIRWASEQRQASSSREERPKTLLLPPMSNVIREQRAQRERVQKLSAISEASNETVEELRARERHLSLDLSINTTSSSIPEEAQNGEKQGGASEITPPLLDFKFINELIYGTGEAMEGIARASPTAETRITRSVDEAHEECLDGFDAEVLKNPTYSPHMADKAESVGDGDSVEEFHPIPLTIDIPLVCDRVEYISSDVLLATPDRHIIQIISRMVPASTAITSTSVPNCEHAYHQLTKVEEMEEIDHDRRLLSEVEESVRTDSGLAMSPLSVSVHDPNSSLPQKRHSPPIQECSEASSTSTAVQLSPRLDRDPHDIMDDSGVFVDFRPGSISVDFPLVVGVDVDGEQQQMPHSGCIFTEEDLRRLIADGTSPSNSDDAAESAEKISLPSRSAFPFDADDPHFKKSGELTWEPLESLEAERSIKAQQQSVESADGDAKFQNGAIGNGAGMLSEAELLAALSEGSSFCAHPKVSIDIASDNDDEGKSSEAGDNNTAHLYNTPLDAAEAVSTASASASATSKTSIAPKWEPLESLHPTEGSGRRASAELADIPSPPYVARQKKFSEELDLYERQLKTEDPHSVVERYNEWAKRAKARGEGSSEEIHAELHSTLSSAIVANASIVVEEPLRASDQFGQATLDVRSTGRGKKRSHRPSMDSHIELGVSADGGADGPTAAPVGNEDGLGIPLRPVGSIDNHEIHGSPERPLHRPNPSTPPQPLPKLSKDGQPSVHLPSHPEEARYRSYDYIVEHEHIHPLHSEHQQQQQDTDRWWDYRRPIEELFPTVRVTTTHPSSTVGESVESYEPPQVMHRIWMNRRAPRPHTTKELVVEHIDVTEINCIYPTRSAPEIHHSSVGEAADGDRIEQRREQGRSKSHVEVEGSQRQGNYRNRWLAVEKVPESCSSWRSVPIRVLDYAREKHGLENASSRDERCCPRLSTEQLGEEGDRQQEYLEYLLCRNPLHVRKRDHCDPQRLYLRRRSSVRDSPPRGAGSIDFAPPSPRWLLKSVSRTTNCGREHTSLGGRWPYQRLSIPFSVEIKLSTTESDHHVTL